MRPHRIPANQPAARFYRGGERIGAFRGTGPADPFTPEDWVASVTPLFGESDLGRTRIDGVPLAELLTADPLSWLGPDHVARWADDPALLVKLLDAGERLPVHVHPHRDFAAAHLGLAHGKAEAWHLLEPAEVHLGWRRPIGAEELAGWVATQDDTAMLGATHRMEVAAGDTVYVPPGFPHAIGSGAFLVEVQEPTDLSILLEWNSFAIDGATAGHLGLGFDVALGAVDLTPLSTTDLDRLVVRAGNARLLPTEADPYFRLDRVVAGDRLDPGYAILVVTAGSGHLVGVGWQLDVRAGETLLAAYASGPITLTGDLTVLCCRPPAAMGGGVDRAISPSPSVGPSTPTR